MKGKKGYPVACKTKDTVERAARKTGGRVDGGNNADHKSKDIGALPDGAAGGKHAGRQGRAVHGKPLMSAAAGQGSNPKGHRSSVEGIGGKGAK